MSAKQWLVRKVANELRDDFPHVNHVMVDVHEEGPRGYVAKVGADVKGHRFYAEKFDVNQRHGLAMAKKAVERQLRKYYDRFHEHKFGAAF